MADEVKPEDKPADNQMSEALTIATGLLKQNQPFKPRNREERRAMQRQKRRKQSS